MLFPAPDNRSSAIYSSVTPLRHHWTFDHARNDCQRRRDRCGASRLVVREAIRRADGWLGVQRFSDGERAAPEFAESYAAAEMPTAAL